MALPAEILLPRWRRLDAAMGCARDASSSLSTATDMPDAVVWVLHAMYDLWDVWAAGKQLSGWREQDGVAATSVEGEAAVALIFARGKSTHGEFVEFAEGFGLGTQPFGVSPFGGGWYWREFVDPKQEERSTFYRRRVAGQPALAPLDAAYRWFNEESVIRRLDRSPSTGDDVDERRKIGGRDRAGEHVDQPGH